jgi:hypothetical protein
MSRNTINSRATGYCRTGLRTTNIFLLRLLLSVSKKFTKSISASPKLTYFNKIHISQSKSVSVSPKPPYFHQIHSCRYFPHLLFSSPRMSQLVSELFSCYLNRARSYDWRKRRMGQKTKQRSENQVAFNSVLGLS